MPFNPNEVYVMEIPNTPTRPQIVLGAYQTRAFREGTDKEPAIQYWYTGGLRPFHTIFGDITEESGDRIEVKSRHFTYHFKPLTLERWHKLGESGNILHYHHIKDDFEDDNALKNYYITTFLPVRWSPPQEEAASDTGDANKAEVDKSGEKPDADSSESSSGESKQG